METNKKIKISIMAFGGIFIIFLFFAYLPLFFKILENNENLALARDDYFSLKEKRVNLENTRKNFSEFEKKVGKIDSLFLEYENPVEFLNYLDETGRNCGISHQISNLSFGEAGTGGLPSLSLGLSFQSGFSEFSKFLESLNSSSWLLQIESLNIWKRENEVAASFILKVFCKKNETSAE
jgi:hypothetical protein